jgi:hypothetical protein
MRCLGPMVIAVSRWMQSVQENGLQAPNCQQDNSNG